MERNIEKEEEKEEIYLGNKIIAYRYRWEDYNENDDKFETKSKVYCILYRAKSKPLNLGECNDGSKFTSVNQAINQAKEFINICNKNGW